MDPQVIAKITELVISKLTQEMNNNEGKKSSGLSEMELQDWQVNNLLGNCENGQFPSTKTYNLQSLSQEELNDWQSLNVDTFSSDQTKAFQQSTLIKFKKFN